MKTDTSLFFSRTCRQLLLAASTWLVVTGTFAIEKTVNTAPDKAIPSDSVYRLNINLDDQDGTRFDLPSLRGKPLLVSMFYNSCQFVCPMLVETIRETEDALPAAQRESLKVLLVTIDPERDNAAVLKQLFVQRKLDKNHWIVARTDPNSVRKLAATLGIQYRKLPNGDFNHSTTIVLLDRDGKIVGTTAKLGEIDHEFMRKLGRVLGQ